MDGLTHSVTIPTPRWLSLRFPSRALERAFLDRFAVDALPRYRLIIPIVLAVWLSYGVLDHHLFRGDALDTARLVRFAIVTPVIVGVLAFGYAPARWFARYWQLAMATGYAFVVGALVYMGSIVNPGSLHHSPPAVSVALLGGYTMVMMRFVYAVPVAAMCTIAAALLYTDAYSPHGFLQATLDTGVVWVVLANVIGMFACYELERFRRDKFVQRLLLEHERERAETLLLNILPASAAERLKAGDTQLVDGYESVTVLFGDLVGFTALAERVPPAELVHTLNELFTEFDEIAERRGLEKIKTIGDAYMVVGGVPVPRADHAEAVCEMALEMLEVVDRRKRRGDQTLDIRIGVHTGPVVAGVIGVKRFSYDVWGDTVNIASRMQSHGVSGAVQVSESTYRRLRERYELEPRGSVELKGKGAMPAFLLTGHRDAV